MTDPNRKFAQENYERVIDELKWQDLVNFELRTVH